MSPRVKPASASHSAERSLSGPDFTATFTVDRTPEEAYTAINNVRGWWLGEPGIEGPTGKLGDEFTYRYKDLHLSKQKVTELVPNKRIGWLVTDADLAFTKDRSEWKGTRITFEISKNGDRTEVRFVRLGLVPEVECFDACSTGWRYYVSGSLRKFIAKGKGKTGAR